MINQERILQEFMELVSIDSVSRKERLVADKLKEKLAAIGLRVEEDGTGEREGSSAGNVIGHLEGNTPGPALMFMAHMDTVEPGVGINPVIRDGVVYSQGDTILGADDKAGIVAVLEALRVIMEHKLPHPKIEAVFTVMEETGLLGAKNLELNRVSPDYVFALDNVSAAGGIYTKGPAQNSVDVTIRGRAAHAGGNPEDGISAIQVAADAISRMRLGRIDEETTANLGVINGGTATNIVCETIHIKGEARSRNMEKLNAQTKHMVNLFQEAATKFGARAHIATELIYPLMDVGETEPMVSICVDAAKAVGIEPAILATGGGSDTNILIGRGLNCVNLGVGMQKPHTTDEFIAVEDLYLSARYILAIIAEAVKRGTK